MSDQTPSRYRFPWRRHNKVELLADGPSFFPAMLGAIEEARSFILMEMYLVEPGETLERFIDALLAAAGRGVQCFLLFDGFGAHTLGQRERQRLSSHPGIELRFYNPPRLIRWHNGWWRLLFRDHRKLLLVDNRVAFTGGAGISDQFAGSGGWHDLMVQLQGECVHDWFALFMEQWPGPAEPLAALRPPRSVAPPTELTQAARVTLSQMAGRQEIQRSLLKRIKGASGRVWIATAYFVPPWKLRRALKRAARRGADVRLMLPGAYTDHPAIRHAGRRYYHGLLRHGVRIFEYQPRFTHAKAYLCDQWCSIGSSNLDRWNMHWNLEANLEIADQTFIRLLQRQLEADLAQCQEITLASWQARPWYRRLPEWFWGRIDLWLARLSARLRR